MGPRTPVAGRPFSLCHSTRACLVAASKWEDASSSLAPFGVRTRCPARESSDRSHLTLSPSLPSLSTGGAWAALRSLPGKAAAALVPKRLADLDSLSFPRGGRTRRSLAVVVDLPVTPDILRTNERTNELMRYSWYPNTDLDPNRRPLIRTHAGRTTYTTRPPCCCCCCWPVIIRIE